MSVIFFFIDGIGISEKGDKNPFSLHSYPSLEILCGKKGLTSESPEIITNNHVFLPVDARLGVEGLPQSGTGQTALFTGKNAAKQIGKHFGPYPHSGIKPMLKESGIFQEFIARRKRPVFLNAYPPVFFERAKKTRRWSCTTLMAKYAEMPLFSTNDVMNGNALTAEFYGDFWRDQLNIPLPKRSSDEIAHIIIRAADQYDFVMFEYYLTDKAGHKKDAEFAHEVISRLDRVLLSLIKQNRDHTIVLCSDHGNLENLATKTHTKNPVPLIAYGPDAIAFKNAKSIMDVKAAILGI